MQMRVRVCAGVQVQVRMRAHAFTDTYVDKARLSIETQTLG